MKSAYDWDIDFDAWSALATGDPHRFEQQRTNLINEVLGFAPEKRQQRLRGLQWRIDNIRKTSSTPLAACIKLSNMMHDSVLGKGGLQEKLHMLTGVGANPMPAASSRCIILNFSRPRASD